MTLNMTLNSLLLVLTNKLFKNSQETLRKGGMIVFRKMGEFSAPVVIISFNLSTTLFITPLCVEFFMVNPVPLPFPAPVLHTYDRKWRG